MIAAGLLGANLSRGDRQHH